MKRRKPAAPPLERGGFARLIGESRAMTRVSEQLRHIAATRAAVLIEGEPGTGKELAARLLHEHSPRRDGPYVRFSFEGLPDAGAEAELYGREAGAARDREEQAGYFERGDGGTLFLDAIEAASPAVQARLLRAIQDRSFERVGGSEARHADVRVVAAPRGELAEAVAAGRFRDDLYQRLSAVRVRMPALRDRIEDLPLLIETFIHEFDRAHRRRVTGITRGALERLARHAWPGNVRELRDTVQFMVVAAGGRRRLDFSDLPDRLRAIGDTEAPLELAVGMTVEEAERQLIAATLRHTGQDKRRAAALLGIGLRTLYRKIDQYALH